MSLATTLERSHRTAPAEAFSGGWTKQRPLPMDEPGFWGRIREMLRG